MTTTEMKIELNLVCLTRMNGDESEWNVFLCVKTYAKKNFPSSIKLIGA